MKTLFSLIFTLMSILAIGQTPTNGLIYKFQFNGNLNDEGPSSDHATNHGASFTKDRCYIDSSVIAFDGTNYINLGKMDSLHPHMTNHSYSFWIKSSFNGFEEFFGTSNDAGSGIRFGMGVNSNNDLSFYLRDSANRSFKYSASSSQLDPCEWHHVVYVIHNALSDSIRVYINGSQVSLTKHSTPAGNPSAFNNAFDHDLVLGAFNDRGTIKYHHKSKIDNFYIYNRSIDSAEALSIYNTGCCNNVLDTTTITNYDTIAIYDTARVEIFDTTEVTIYDTTEVIIIDTLYTTIFDTTETTVFDTSVIEVYDTNYVTVEDTLNFEVNTGSISSPDYSPLKVYPNPAGSQITIEMPNYIQFSGFRVKIYNALGSEVYNQPISSGTLTVSTSAMGGAGTYYLEVYSPPSDVRAHKVIIVQ